MSFVIIFWNSEGLEIFFFFFFICLFVVCCFFFLRLLEVKTLKVKCCSLHFFLLPIFNGKNLHRIEHTKRFKQGQDCQKVIAKKCLRIYINIYIYIYINIYFFITTVFLVFDLLDSFNLENVWYISIISWKTFHHVFCNNCLEFQILGKFFIFYLFVCLFLFSLFLFFCFLFFVFFLFCFCFVLFCFLFLFL